MRHLFVNPGKVQGKGNRGAQRSSVRKLIYNVGVLVYILFNAPGIFIPSDTYKAESAFLRLRAVSLFPKCDIELESFSNSPGFTGMEE